MVMRLVCAVLGHPSWFTIMTKWSADTELWRCTRCPTTKEVRKQR